MKQFDVIVAYDKRRGIGLNNGLPWKLKNELKWFQKLTTRTEQSNQLNAIIMGKNTWESLGKRPLKNRINIVVSTSLTDDTDSNSNLYFVKSFDAALELVDSMENIDNVIIIGGQKLYESVIDHSRLRHLYVTQIDEVFDCDSFFPKIDYTTKTELDNVVELDQKSGREIRYTISCYTKN